MKSSIVSPQVQGIWRSPAFRDISSDFAFRMDRSDAGEQHPLGVTQAGLDTLPSWLDF
jgi:hypothetical protein